MNVYNVNDAPIGQSDEYTVLPNTPLVVALADGLLSNDFDEEGDALTATIVKLPEHGTLTPNADGTFTYTADPTYFGPDSFEYTVSDSIDVSGPVKVDILVGGVLEDEEPPEEAERDPKHKDTARGTTIDAVSDALDPAPTEIVIEGSRNDRRLATAANDIAASVRMRTTDSVSVDRQAAGYDELFVSVNRDVDEVKRGRGAVAEENLEHIGITSVLWSHMDRMVEQGGITALTGRLTVGVAALMVAAATYAYVIWTVWGGYLVTSVMSMMPGWRFIDPLPVLDQEASQADDQESLASLLDDNS